MASKIMEKEFDETRTKHVGAVLEIIEEGKDGSLTFGWVEHGKIVCSIGLNLLYSGDRTKVKYIII